MMYKKSQGLSINVIIMVAIALIVLVVLIAVFTGRLGNFVGGLDETTSDCYQQCKAAGMSGGEPLDASCTGTRVGNCCCEGSIERDLVREENPRE